MPWPQVSALAVLNIAPDTIALLHVVSVFVLCVCFGPFHTAVQLDSEMSFVDWRMHGVGSSAKRDGRRGAVQHCHVSTFTVVTGCAQFDCTVQLVIGLGSTHLP